jgi:hypothetical protein
MVNAPPALVVPVEEPEAIETRPPDADDEVPTDILMVPAVDEAAPVPR